MSRHHTLCPTFTTPSPALSLGRYMGLHRPIFRGNNFQSQKKARFHIDHGERGTIAYRVVTFYGPACFYRLYVSNLVPADNLGVMWVYKNVGRTSLYLEAEAMFCAAEKWNGFGMRRAATLSRRRCVMGEKIMGLRGNPNMVYYQVTRPFNLLALPRGSIHRYLSLLEIREYFFAAWQKSLPAGLNGHWNDLN